MQVVILCGGESLRFQNDKIPYNKVMAPIGKHPLLVHVMNIYHREGYSDFLLCVRNDDEIITKYFSNQTLFNDVKVVKTGNNTLTGGRLLKVKDYINSEHFFVTYGDGLCDLDLKSLVKFHLSHEKLGTLTAVHPQSQYGILEIDHDNIIQKFIEKPIMNDWINGGFFLFNREVFLNIPHDEMLETGLLYKLANKNQLMAYKHNGFWKSMDTLKEFTEINFMANTNKAFFLFNE